MVGEGCCGGITTSGGEEKRHHIAFFLEMLLDDWNPFGGLAPERARLENRCRLNTYIAIDDLQ